MSDLRLPKIWVAMAYDPPVAPGDRDPREVTGAKCLGAFSTLSAAMSKVQAHSALDIHSFSPEWDEVPPDHPYMPEIRWYESDGGTVIYGYVQRIHFDRRAGLTNRRGR